MKEYVKKHKDIILVIAIFIIFAIFLIFQHQFLYLYHDDYGYASLSYIGGAPENIHGTNFTFSDIINFLQKHYMNWGRKSIIIFCRSCWLTLFRIKWISHLTSNYYFRYFLFNIFNYEQGLRQKSKKMDNSTCDSCFIWYYRI